MLQNLEFWQKKVIFSSKFLKQFRSSGKEVAQKRCKTGKKVFIAFLCDNIWAF
jgi:hypothetical protein